jgi:chromosome segregation ATPase
MTGPYQRPDQAVITEVETLVRHLADELGAWRRRCLRSEAELGDLKARSATGTGPGLSETRARAVELEQENVELRRRLEAARERLGALTARLAFLERGLTERL